MEAIKIRFLNELSDLEKLIEYYTIESKLMDNLNQQTKNPQLLIELSAKISEFYISKKQFNYNSIIISLYGSFERFIENCLSTYVENLNKFTLNYDKLPVSVLKHHLALSILLLNKVDNTKYSGPLSKSVIIKNLNDCLSQNNPYELNKEAFAQHSANFRLLIIEDSFKRLGIQTISNKILKNCSFRSFIINKYEISTFADIKIKEAFQLLDDLAERRNEVAHGVSNELLQNEILLDYVLFFRYYCTAMIEVLEDELILIEIKLKGRKLGKITNVYHDGEVICFWSNKIPFKVGDTIIGLNGTAMQKTNIRNIQIEGEDIDFVDGDEDYEVGVKIDEKFKKNFKLYIL